LGLACSLTLAAQPTESAAQEVPPAAGGAESATTPPSDEGSTGPGEAEVERARVLFAEGLVFVEQHDWVQAERRFREVLAIRSSHVVSYNLASALVHLGRLTESAELLRVILRDAQADLETRQAAERLLAEIEPQIGSITIRVLGDIRGAWLRLDETPIELTARVMTLSVDPGTHSLSVERNGALLGVREIAVGGDRALRAEALFELPPVSGAASSEPPPLHRPEPRISPSALDLRADPGLEDDAGLLSRWWFWGGVALVAATATITAVALSAGDDPASVTGDTDPPVIGVRVQGER
jgi:hypothetical protein